MNLILHLKREYVDQIANGQKLEEYRRVTPYWTKRLEARQYRQIILLCGYPARNDLARKIIRPWRGMIKKVIQHPYFGNQLVQVFAIDVSPNKPPNPTC